MNISENSTSLFSSQTPGLAITVSVVIMVLNSIGITLVVKNPELESRIKVCIVGHCVSDLGFGIVLGMTATSKVLKVNLSTIVCFINGYGFLMLSVLTSILSLLQALDQFFILRFTYAYSSWISRKKMVITVITVYIVCIFTSLVILHGFEPSDECALTLISGRITYMITLASICICILLLIPLYIYIGLKIFKISNNIASTLRSVDHTELARQRKRQKETAITLSMIVVLFIVCYTPMAALDFKLLLEEWDNRFEIHPNQFSVIVAFFFGLNSAANPIVYIWRLRSTRTQCAVNCNVCCKTCLR